MKQKGTLRLIRIFFAGFFFIGITLLLLDTSGVLYRYLSWIAKLQFLPAVLAVNLSIALPLLALTLLFGRFYCSTLCPLGVWQDVVSHCADKQTPHRFRYSHNKKWLRLFFLCVALVGIFSSLNILLSLLAPYSIWGRIVTHLFQPLWGYLTQIISQIEQHFELYYTFPREVYLKSLVGLISSLFFLLIISLLAWKKGRVWCNEVCPVGTVLGYTAKFALFKPSIDYKKCIGCKKCERNCKASCINIKAHKVDYSRCVDCFNCLAQCPVGAISYASTWKIKPQKQSDTASKPDMKRRALLTSLAVVLPAQALAQKVDGGLTLLEKKKTPERKVVPVPAGSVSIDNMEKRCTACGLCVSKCPAQVLKPSTELHNLMQTTMTFDKGYCRPECTVCSQVCPTGAILKITPEEKSAIHIGHAVWIKETCLPFAEGESCGNCARHCPVGAIRMVKISDSGLSGKGAPDENLRIPLVNESRCIGCGACEHYCPTRPLSSIYVEGHMQHRID